MSNPILNFCSVVTALTALSVLNISSANALSQANQVSGDVRAAVSAEPRGLNRRFEADANADAIGRRSATTNTNVGVVSTPNAAETNATASAQAGRAQGSANSVSNVNGAGTGPTDLRLGASNRTTAELRNSRNGNVTAGSSSRLDSTGGNAVGVGTFMGTTGR